MSEKFEQAVQKYFSKYKELEYLDLEIPKSELRISGSIEYNCFREGHKHKIYTEHEQLNFLSDSSLTILHNLACTFRQINLNSKVNLKHFYDIENKLETLRKENVELKTTQKRLLSLIPGENLGKILKDLPTKNEVQQLISTVFEHPKKVEQEAIKLTEKLDQKLNQVEELLKETQREAKGIAQHF